MKIDFLCDAVHEDIEGEIESVEFASEADLLIKFTCDDWENLDRRRQFNFKCSNVQKYDLPSKSVWGLQWAFDHPVLWEFTSEPCHLYFKSLPTDPFSIIGRLYEAHETLYQGWGDMRDFLNFSSRVHKLTASKHGLLAKGPRIVLEAYSAAVEGVFETYITSQSNIRYDSEASQARALILDEGYVVCREVTVSEVP